MGGKDDGKETKAACDATVNTLKPLKEKYGGWHVHEQNHPSPGFIFWLATQWDDDRYLGAREYFSAVLKGSFDCKICASVPGNDKIHLSIM